MPSSHRLARLCDFAGRLTFRTVCCLAAVSALLWIGSYLGRAFVCVREQPGLDYGGVLIVPGVMRVLGENQTTDLTRGAVYIARVPTGAGLRLWTALHNESSISWRPDHRAVQRHLLSPVRLMQDCHRASRIGRDGYGWYFDIQIPLGLLTWMLAAWPLVHLWRRFRSTAA